MPPYPWPVMAVLPDKKKIDKSSIYVHLRCKSNLLLFSLASINKYVGTFCPGIEVIVVRRLTFSPCHVNVLYNSLVCHSVPAD